MHWWIARNCPTSNGAYSEAYALTWVRQSISRGRGKVEGVSYRVAQADGNVGHFAHPLSLDWQYESSADDEVATLGDVMIDVAAVTDHLAVGAVMCAEITARAESLCQNGMDREVVASWSSTDTYTSIAQRHGVSREYVRRRACRIREHLADWLEDQPA